MPKVDIWLGGKWIGQEDNISMATSKVSSLLSPAYLASEFALGHSVSLEMEVVEDE